MKLYEFNKLDSVGKYDVVFTKGVYLDVIIEGNIRSALYAVSMFFVVVLYDNASNKIVGCQSFKTGHLLDKFSNF